LARQINDDMPQHVLKLVDEAFEEMGIAMRGSRVTVLGLGFKANSGDLRNTQSKPIVNGLRERNADVVAHDPFVKTDELNRVLPNLKLAETLEEALKKSRCTVIVTDHLRYRNLTAEFFGKMMSKPCAVVDARHIIHPEEASVSGLVFRGLGKPGKKQCKSAG